VATSRRNYSRAKRRQNAAVPEIPKNDRNSSNRKAKEANMGECACTCTYCETGAHCGKKKNGCNWFRSVRYHLANLWHRLGL